MANTTFVDYQAPAVNAAWLNDVNSATYNTLSGIKSVLEYIPVAEHAAILANTSVYDCTSAFNQAIAENKTVFVPSGTYLITRPINMTARNSGDYTYQGRVLIGAGMSNTIINAYTGNYPMLDLTGNNRCVVWGMNFRSDNPPAGFSAADCASTGIMHLRGDNFSGSQTAHYNRIGACQFDMASDMSRNGGMGTIGYINSGGEHLITDGLIITANVPLVHENTLSFTPSYSQNISTYGSEYEPHYTGSPISTTIIEHRNSVLVAVDSHRAIHLNQIGHIEFPNLYLGELYRSDLTPSYSESLYLKDVTNLKLDAYQEASGLFSGPTYRMDSRFTTIAGVCDNWNLRIRRGALNKGFTIPGAASSFHHLENAASLRNFEIDCNYLPGIYNDSSDNNGFAALPVTYSGTPTNLINGVFTTDQSGSHTADIFSSIGAYCTNVNNINYLSGENYYGNIPPTAFTPTIIGSSGAGTGTYSTQSGNYSRSGRICQFTTSLVWSNHTGTGDLQIADLPYTAHNSLAQAVSVVYSAINVGAGKQLTAYVIPNTNKIALFSCDPANTTNATLSIETAGTLIVSGTYYIA